MVHPWCTQGFVHRELSILVALALSEVTQLVLQIWPQPGLWHAQVPPKQSGGLRPLQGGEFIASVLVPPAGQKKTRLISIHSSFHSCLDRFHESWMLLTFMFCGFAWWFPALR